MEDHLSWKPENVSLSPSKIYHEPLNVAPYSEQTVAVVSYPHNVLRMFSGEFPIFILVRHPS